MVAGPDDPDHQRRDVRMLTEESAFETRFPLIANQGVRAI